MSDLPEPVQRFRQALAELSGVRDVAIGLQGLEGLDETVFSLPGEYGDLPHATLRRTHGGLEGEFLVTAELRFSQDQAGWVALEFLAWWVRDLSRSGEVVQIRPLALPPVAYGTQLGRTLKFIVEFFFVTEGGHKGPILERLGQLADSLEQNRNHYAEALAQPTQAEFEDLDALRHAAEIGDADAQCQLAGCYLRGDGVEPDASEAFTWHEKAARWGHPHAMLNLAIQYERGDGVDQDFDQAFHWYMKAAEVGVPLAMGSVGECYEQGRGVEADPVQAVDWYRKAADAGQPACQAQLGECYELGKGVPVNLQEALRWYEAALDNGLEAVKPALERVRQKLGA